VPAPAKNSPTEAKGEVPADDEPTENDDAVPQDTAQQQDADEKADLETPEEDEDGTVAESQQNAVAPANPDHEDPAAAGDEPEAPAAANADDSGDEDDGRDLRERDAIIAEMERLLATANALAATRALEVEALSERLAAYDAARLGRCNADSECQTEPSDTAAPGSEPQAVDPAAAAAAEELEEAAAARLELEGQIEDLQRQLALKERLVLHLETEIGALRLINAAADASPKARPDATSTDHEVDSDVKLLVNDGRSVVDAIVDIRARVRQVGQDHADGGIVTTVEGLVAAVLALRTELSEARSELAARSDALKAQQRRLVKLADANKAMADSIEEGRQLSGDAAAQATAHERAALVELVWATYVHADSGMRALSRHLAEVRKLKRQDEQLYRDLVPDLNTVVRGLGEASQTSYAMVRQCLTEEEREHLRVAASADGNNSASPEPEVPSAP
jgi:hypothetical protein